MMSINTELDALTKAVLSYTTILKNINTSLINLNTTIGQTNKTLGNIALNIRIIREKEYPDVALESDPVSIFVEQKLKGTEMKCNLPHDPNTHHSTVKKMMAASGPMKANAFSLIDGATPGTYTVVGKNEAGETVALDGLATLVVTSDNTNVVIGPVTGMTVPISALATGGTGTGNVTFVITMNDPSTATAPSFTAIDVFSFSGGKITGIDVQGP